MLVFHDDTTTPPGLAHIIFTGNERLVFDVIKDFRELRRHCRFVGLQKLSKHDARELVRAQAPGISDDDFEHLWGVIGGSAKELLSVCSEYCARDALVGSGGDAGVGGGGDAADPIIMDQTLYAVSPVSSENARPLQRRRSNASVKTHIVTH